MSILSFFVLEVIVKIIVMPRIFLKHKLEILDAIVIILSFSLNVYLLFRKDDLESVVGLFALLRLWRIWEIING